MAYIAHKRFSVNLFGLVTMGLRQLESIALIRPLLRGVVSVWNKLTIQFLSLAPEVDKIFLRGSYARGTARSFHSDLDLAIILKNTSPRRSLDQELSFSKWLNAAAFINPLLRDQWQCLATRREIENLGGFWPVVAQHEWKQVVGAADSLSLKPLKWSVLCAVSLNRAYFWSHTPNPKKVRYYSTLLRQGLELTDAEITVEKFKALDAFSRSVAEREGAVEEPYSQLAQLAPLVGSRVSSSATPRLNSKEQNAVEWSRAPKLAKLSEEIERHASTLHHAYITEGRLVLVTPSYEARLWQQLKAAFAKVHDFPPLTLYTQASGLLAPEFESRQILFSRNPEKLNLPPPWLRQQFEMEWALLPISLRVALRHPKRQLVLSYLFWKSLQRVLLIKHNELYYSRSALIAGLLRHPTLLTGDNGGGLPFVGPQEPTPLEFSAEQWHALNLALQNTFSRE